MGRSRSCMPSIKYNRLFYLLRTRRQLHLSYMYVIGPIRSQLVQGRMAFLSARFLLTKSADHSYGLFMCSSSAGRETPLYVVGGHSCEWSRCSSRVKLNSLISYIIQATSRFILQTAAGTCSKHRTARDVNRSHHW
jgi:hypothetical protein